MANDILIIENDSETINQIDAALGVAGYNVSSAMTAEDGIAAAQGSVPAMILINLATPGTKGLEICKTIHNSESLSQVPIILLTLREGKFDPVYTKLYGIVSFLNKPFEDDALMALVQQHAPIAEEGYADDFDASSDAYDTSADEDFDKTEIMQVTPLGGAAPSVSDDGFAMDDAEDIVMQDDGDFDATEIMQAPDFSRMQTPADDAGDETVLEMDAASDDSSVFSLEDTEQSLDDLQETFAQPHDMEAEDDTYQGFEDTDQTSSLMDDDSFAVGEEPVDSSGDWGSMDDVEAPVEDDEWGSLDDGASGGAAETESSAWGAMDDSDSEDVDATMRMQVDTSAAASDSSDWDASDDTLLDSPADTDSSDWGASGDADDTVGAEEWGSMEGSGSGADDDEWAASGGDDDEWSAASEDETMGADDWASEDDSKDDAADDEWGGMEDTPDEDTEATMRMEVKTSGDDDGGWDMGSEDDLSFDDTASAFDNVEPVQQEGAQGMAKDDFGFDDDMSSDAGDGGMDESFDVPQMNDDESDDYSDLFDDASAKAAPEPAGKKGAKKTKAKKKGPAGAGSPLKKILILVVVLAVLGGGGFAAYTMFFAAPPKPKQTVKRPTPPRPAPVEETTTEEHVKIAPSGEISDNDLPPAELLDSLKDSSAMPMAESAKPSEPSASAAKKTAAKRAATPPAAPAPAAPSKQAAPSTAAIGSDTLAPGYYVQFGVFSSQANAERKVYQLGNENLIAQIVPRPSSKHGQVYFVLLSEPYASYSPALTKAKAIKAALKIDTAVHHQK